MATKGISFEEHLSTSDRAEFCPTDWSKIVTPATEVLVLGESHPRENAKGLIIGVLSKLKAQGFTHLAMEVLGADIQTDVDDYLETGRKREKLEEYICKHYCWSPNAVELYLKMIDQAKKLGIRVVGIDSPNSNKDPEMAAEVDHLFSHQGQDVRVIAYVGSNHAKKLPGAMAGILTAGGRQVISVRICGGSSIEDSLTDSYARSQGLEGKEFLFDYRNTEVPFDWAMHLPQVEEATEYEKNIIFFRLLQSFI